MAISKPSASSPDLPNCGGVRRLIQVRRRQPALKIQATIATHSTMNATIIERLKATLMSANKVKP